ncbi:GIY-YIG nuclease family protein [Micrococcus endophyticus]
MTHALTPARLDATAQDVAHTFDHGPVFELRLTGDGGPEWGVAAWADGFGPVPDAPGLYAVYAKALERVRRELGPAVPVGEDGLLYIGKAETSLAERDVAQHFGTGKTGRSTVRRTFAALLEHSALLWPVPRAGKKPSSKSPATFDLSERSEEALTRWMVDHLALRVWVPEVPVALGDIEKRVITAWRPPLNLTHAGPRPHIKAARAWMVALAAAQEEAEEDRLPEGWEPASVGDLFRERPEQYGLRGSDGLWTELRVRFASEPMPASRAELQGLVESAIEEILGEATPYDRESVHMDRYNVGGMSQGLVHLPWWRETAVPMILDRWQKWADARGIG